MDGTGTVNVDELEFEQKIHDIVDGASQPMNGNQVFQIMMDRGEEVTIQQVRDAIAALVSRGMLVDAKLPSYFAVG